MARPSLGSPVSVADADEHLFGVVLLNDWSARDLQAWEYVPLGPFLGKSFATTISPWVVTTDALRSARVPLPGQTDPTPLPYLRGETTDDGAGTAYGLDITYEVEWNGTVVSRPPYRSLYWSPAQMVAHMTVNGATLRNGDLFGSGTISGPEKDQRGSFLEPVVERPGAGDAGRRHRADVPRGRRHGGAACDGARPGRHDDLARRVHGHHPARALTRAGWPSADRFSAGCGP